MRRLLIFLSLILVTTCFGQAGNVNVKPLPGMQFVNRTHRLGRGLVGYWPFNERSGKIHNLAQNYNHETSRVDVTWAAGKFGLCNSFPGGAGDYIKCGIVAEPLKLLSTDFTLLIWANPDSITGDTTFFAAMEADSDGWMWMNDDGKSSLFMDGSVVREDNINIVAGEWKQYAITFRVSDKQLKFYNNGVLDSTGNHSKVPVDTVGREFIFGVDGRDYSDKRWDGLLDMPMVWRRILSASEIAQLYRDPFCMFKQGNVALMAEAAAPPPSGGQVIIIQMGMIPLLFVTALILRRKCQR